MEHTIKVDEKDHALDGQNKMNSFRNEKKHCDFIIKVESEEISVHRNVICSRSDYFDAMFSHDTKEKRSGVAEIKGVDRECTVKCVDFMYTGETSIKEENCGELMHVATLFQLLTLCNAIAAFLEEKLNCKLFFETRKLADFYSCQKLVDACKEFAVKHFKEIVQSSEFTEIDEEFVGCLVTLEGLQVSEAEKCKLVVEWFKVDSSSRKDSLLRLIKKLDFNKIEPSFKRFLVENEPTIHAFHEVYEILAISILDHEDVGSHDIKFASNGTEKIVLFDMFSEGVESFDLVTKTWTSMQSVEDVVDMALTTTAVLDHYLYVFTSENQVYRIFYSDPDAVWEPLAPKNLCDGSAVILDGLIYTNDSMNFNKSIECYSPATDEWTMLPDKSLNFLGSLAAAEGKIFSIGGGDSIREFRADVEIFDPKTSMWQFDNPLNKARESSSTCTVDDGIYVLGGVAPAHTNLSEVEYRCPKSKTWMIITPMMNSRSYFNSLHINGKIYAVGGDDDVKSGVSRTIEEYDLSKKEWKIIHDFTEDIYPLPLTAVVLKI